MGNPRPWYRYRENAIWSQREDEKEKGEKCVSA